jgi:hypothetical protein
VICHANDPLFPGGQRAGKFISWQISAAEAENPSNEDLGDQPNPGLLFINQMGPGLGAIQPQERKRMRSHVMQSHIYKRNERAVDEKGKGKQRQIGLQPLPNIDRLLGAGDLDPFNSLPVIMSSSNSRLLHYCKSSTIY